MAAASSHQTKNKALNSHYVFQVSGTLGILREVLPGYQFGGHCDFTDIMGFVRHRGYIMYIGPLDCPFQEKRM